LIKLLSLRTNNSGEAEIEYNFKLKNRTYETRVLKNENFVDAENSLGTQIKWMKLSETQVNYFLFLFYFRYSILSF
jgi:hypothetical protein